MTGTGLKKCKPDHPRRDERHAAASLRDRKRRRVRCDERIGVPARNLVQDLFLQIHEFGHGLDDQVGPLGRSRCPFRFGFGTARLRSPRPR